MANESYELAVRMRPEGMGETESSLEGVDQSFEDASGSVGDSASEMEGFAGKWQGAMGAIIVGLAVAAAGLLTQVPVIGEAMSGLIAIIEAVAFQMDQVLRPVLQPIADLFFDISEDIFELEGAAGDLVGTLAALALAGGALFAALSKLGVISVSLTGALKALGAIIVGLVTGSIVLGALIGTIIGLFGVWILETLGVLDAIQNVGSWIRDTLPDWVSDGILSVIALFAGPLAVIGGFIVGFIEGGFEEGFARAREVVDIFIGAIKRTLQRAFEAIFEPLADLAAPFADEISAALHVAGPTGSGMAFDAARTVLDGGGGGESSNQSQQQSTTTQASPSLALDGRDLTEDTGRYEVDRTTRRGRGP